jgi:hypothetical protein
MDATEHTPGYTHVTLFFCVNEEWIAHGLLEQEPCHGPAAARGADPCGHDATRPCERAGSQRARHPIELDS